VADQLCGLREQNLIAGAFLKPHLKHLAFRDAPHARQHLIPLAFSNPQAWQRIEGPLGPPTPIDPSLQGFKRQVRSRRRAVYRRGVSRARPQNPPHRCLRDADDLPGAPRSEGARRIGRLIAALEKLASPDWAKLHGQRPAKGT
jgi:hypothetical protein